MRASERVDVTIEFETMRQLQAELGPCLAIDGLFVLTDDPAPVESEVGLRVMLPDGFVAFQATGVVIWRRQPGLDQDPPGMAVRYSLVPSESQETIDAIIDAHLSSGGELFDLERVTEDGDVFPTDALDSERWQSVPSEEIQTELETARRMLGELAATSREAGDQEDRVGEPADSLEDGREIVDIRFDEQDPEPATPMEDPDEAGDRELFDAISRAVSAPVPGSPDADDDTGVADGAEESAARSGTEVGEELTIPEILDRLENHREDSSTEPDPDEIDETEETDTEPEAEVEAEPESEPEIEPKLSTTDGGGEARSPGPAAPPSDEEKVAALASRQHAEVVAQDDGAPASELVSSVSPMRWIAVAAVVAVGCLASLMLWKWGLGGSSEEMPGVAAPVATVSQEEAVPAIAATPEGIQPEEPGSDPTTVPELIPSEIPQPRPVPAPGTVVRTVSFDPRQGETRVVVETNRPVAENLVSFLPLSDPPRLLVRLRGIERGFSPQRVEVGSAEVERVRIGFHPDQNPPALYVVLDLADEKVVLTQSEVDGEIVRVTVGRR
jgi:hypothetical protein